MKRAWLIGILISLAALAAGGSWTYFKLSHEQTLMNARLNVLSKKIEILQEKIETEDHHPKFPVVEKLSKKYGVVVGAYLNEKNVQEKALSCEASGYPAEIVKNKEGNFAVVVCLSDSHKETQGRLQELRDKGICSEGGWIITQM